MISSWLPLNHRTQTAPGAILLMIEMKIPVWSQVSGQRELSQFYVSGRVRQFFLVVVMFSIKFPPHKY